jgi:hypothetical protein
MPTVHEANLAAAKLDELSAICGLSVTEFIETYALDEVVPAICMKPDCDFTADLEPDQREGWCEECDTHSMKSGLVLSGLI